ncbi:hypothetical protein EV13_2146 [Prochlorococcus sp. MIT 0702]|nr:hypothetical protein EV13_2146 [Prochlorococcus sp. MIT 0702]
MLPLGEVEANLKVAFSYRSEQIGPVGEGWAGVKGDWDYLFYRWQQIPQSLMGGIAGQLQFALQLVGCGC